MSRSYKLCTAGDAGCGSFSIFTRNENEIYPTKHGKITVKQMEKKRTSHTFRQENARFVSGLTLADETVVRPMKRIFVEKSDK